VCHCSDASSYDLTESIFAAVVPELGEAERARARSKRPESLTAWDCYQRGLWHLYRRTRDDVAEAERARRARPTASFPFGSRRLPNRSRLTVSLALPVTNGVFVDPSNPERFLTPDELRELNAHYGLWPSPPPRGTGGGPRCATRPQRERLDAEGGVLSRSKPGTPFGHEPLLPTPNSALATHA
jgi:hypothetical protein